MNHISAAIREDFEAVNRLVVAKLHSDVGLVENIGQYIVEGGGKRLRPLITLLCARALGYAGTRHIELATVIEFLHTATLLHDDVVDVSAMRRGRATANANWGNAPSVLVGDFIYSRAFQLLVGIGDIAILRLLSDTTNEIAEGEVEQLTRAGDPQTTTAQYMQVIRKKTAVLFASAAQGAALLAGADATTEQALRTFGLNLGIAFQLIDDVLDYSGDPKLMGKNVGDDLAEGKPTLPLIHAIANAPAAEAQCVRRAILERDRNAIDAVLGTVQRCGALDYARSVALEHRELAIAALGCIPESEFRHNLLTITDLAIDRQA
ncbi:MAG: polyprenyl synthetase family protein [Pseudomonadales bacterium]